MLPRNGRLQIALTTALLLVIWFAVRFVLLGNEQHDHRALRQAATAIVNAEQARTAATMAMESARVSARTAEGDVAVALSKAAAARARARAAGAESVIIAAAGAPPVEVPVPPAVVERMRLDSTAVVTLRTVVRWKDTLIVRQDQRIRADSLELLATSHAFHALERMKEPRCGRRCGIALGIGGMLAAAVAVGQVRRTFR